MRYKSEAVFSSVIANKLTKAGYSVVRIESHSTGNGIPDMFVQGRGDDFWLELKNSNKADTSKVSVAWRPGQQAWSHTYYTKHRTKWVVTLMSGKDGVYIISMNTIYNNNEVVEPWFISWKDFDELSCYNVARLLYIASREFVIKDPHTTYREALIIWLEHYFPDAIEWDPEVLWPSELSDIDNQYNSNTMAKAQRKILLDVAYDQQQQQQL